MPLVDRAILRLATFEMLYLDDVPCSVSINEAVELAKSFGGEDESSRFVNGVLGKIAGHLDDRIVGDGTATDTKVESRHRKKALHG
jgi:N utilization substance protein B